MKVDKLPINQVLCGDSFSILAGFPRESIDMVMFSPPYWGLRDYGEQTQTVWGGQSDCEHQWQEQRMSLVHENRNFSKGTQEEVHAEKRTTYIKKYDDKKAGFCVKCGAWKGQLGLEPSWQMYVEHMAMICREIKRLLKKTGSIYIVLGDTYFGGKGKSGAATSNETKERRQKGETLQKAEYEIGTDRPQNFPQLGNYQAKCLMGIPWHVAFILIEDGWTLRNDIIWHKPNHMPSSVKDRLTSSYEHIFHFVQARKYYYDLDAIREPHKLSSIKRVNQNLEVQHGGSKEQAYLRENIIPAGGILLSLLTQPLLKTI